MKPLLLDLFCGAGGAGWGYAQAGFRVVGVDNRPQKHYPFQFIQYDALAFLRLYGKRFDAIHASPPCQPHSKLKAFAGEDKLDLIPQVRELLQAANLPYVIENVVGAPLDAIMLCGTFFGLKVYRHRLFESNKLLLAPSHAPHRDKTPRAGWGVSPKGFISIAGNGGAKGIPAGYTALSYGLMAMGVTTRMTRHELSQAIPPAFTEFLGNQLRGYC